MPSSPTINGNGANEFAVLYQAGNSKIHRVIIKDSKSKKQVGKLTLPAGAELSPGIVVMNNMQGRNKTPEIALLYYTGKASKVQIKDVKRNNTIIRSIKFLDGDYKPKAISVLPDTNGNGADEITVLGVHKDSGKAKMEMRDSKTRKILWSVAF